MKYTKLFLVFVMLSVAACNKTPETTIEEKITMKSFVGYLTALTYDEVCNGTDQKSRQDLKQRQNVMLLGNQSMLAARVGGLWHVRNPEKSVEEGVKYLITIKEKVQSKFKETLNSKGCSSDEAKQAAKAYKLYSEYHPSIIFGLIDKSIKEAGGSVTSSEEIESAGKK